MKTRRLMVSFWLAFLLLFGVGFLVASAAAQPYGLELRIFVTRHFKHNDSGWLDDGFTVTSDVADVQAPSFTVRIHSQNDFKADATKHVRLIGEDRPFTLENGRDPNLTLDVLTKNIKSHYTLILNAGLCDTAGQALGQERRVEIQVRPPTEATFDLLGEDAEYEDLGFYYGGDSWMAARHLTTSPKDIRISFNRNVDRVSVEDSITQGLKGKAEARNFRWIDDRTVNLHIGKQERTSSVDSPLYLITLKQARDVDGHPILGQMSFDVTEPCHLSRIDLTSLKVNTVWEFHDKIYMVLGLPTAVSRFVILDDGWRKFAYNLAGRSLERKALPKGVYEGNLCWLDGPRFLYVRERQLVLHNLADGKETVIYDDLPRKDAGVEALRLSPDQRKVALMFGTQLLVISLDGHLLYQSQEPIRLIQHDFLPPEVNLCWVGNQALIYDAMVNPTDATTNTCNIYKADMKTGRTETFIDGARKPVLSPLGYRIQYEHPTSEGLKHYVSQAGRESELTACGDYACEHFLFVDEDRLVFERQREFTPEIVLLDLKRGQEVVLTTGAMIGLSSDRRYLYTNSFKGQLHYMD